MERTYDYPEEFKEMIGTIQTLSGGLFSGKKAIEEQDFKIHDIRWGSAVVVNWVKMKETGKSPYRHPTIELLVSNDSMSRKRWTRGFAVRSIDFNKLEGEED